MSATRARGATVGHLRAQLVGLKLRALIKKAEELGLPEEEIDAASEAGQEQIVELLLSAMLRAEEAELRAELESLPLRKLLARSAELGVPEAETDAAEESKEQMVELLVAWAGRQRQDATPAEPSLPAWLDEVRGLASIYPEHRYAHQLPENRDQMRSAF